MSNPADQFSVDNAAKSTEIKSGPTSPNVVNTKAAAGVVTTINTTKAATAR